MVAEDLSGEEPHNIDISDAKGCSCRNICTFSHTNTL